MSDFDPFAGNTLGGGGSELFAGGGAPVYPSAATAADMAQYNAGFNNLTGDPGGSGINAAGIAAALKNLSGGLPQARQQSSMPNTPAGQSIAGQAQSGAYQGNPAGINALVQALMARVQALRAASNPANARPVNMASGGVRGAGLLGL